MQDWFPVAITNHGMRTGLLLCASQSLYVRTGASQYHQCALQYKATCLRILGDAIKTIVGTSDSPSASKVDDATISVALQLASDEVSLAYRNGTSTFSSNAISAISLKGVTAN